MNANKELNVGIVLLNKIFNLIEYAKIKNLQRYVILTSWVIMLIVGANLNAVISKESSVKVKPSLNTIVISKMPILDIAEPLPFLKKNNIALDIYYANKKRAIKAIVTCPKPIASFKKIRANLQQSNL